jgi:hypothetical protein
MNQLAVDVHLSTGDYMLSIENGRQIYSSNNRKGRNNRISLFLWKLDSSSGMPRGFSGLHVRVVSKLEA